MRAAALALLALAGCAPGGDAAAVRQYAVNMHANYQDTVTTMLALKSAVDSFTAQPTAAGLEACRHAWLAARPSYGESEVSRFYNGPIEEVQGRVNEWPIDENFIDYTAGNPSGGIINMPGEFPQITPQILATSDQRGGIENLSTGYHALEFLLWGQRLAQTDGPGQRPYTDYLDGGTASNQDRRRVYLRAATDLLISDLSGVAAQWDLEDPASYASAMVTAPSHEGVTRILRGIGSMAVSELYYERMFGAYLTQNRKDEQSCFSQSTLLDLAANALGVENAYVGRYHALAGVSISDLVAERDPVLDARLRAQLTAARAAIDAISLPFDQAVISPAGSAPRLAVKHALDLLAPLADSIREVAALLEVTVNI